MTDCRGFAFGAEDLVLEAIDEDEEMYDDFEVPVTTAGIREKDLVSAKARTATLAAAAEKEMLELSSLLGKLKTGTATRAEKDRLASMSKKLDRMKSDIKVSKKLETETEVKLMKSTTRKKAFDIRKAIKEREIRSVIREVCASESVDLAFIIDCTGSMGSYIAAVKENVKKIVDQILRTNEHLALRLAVVGYRDLCDGGKRFEVHDFDTSVEGFKDFVGKLAATGGADTAEDMAGAVQKSNALKWKFPTRVAFLIADAPCHGREFHSFDDSYPDGTPGIDIKAELKLLLSNHRSDGTMTVKFGRITNQTDSMIRRFEECGIHLEVVSLEDAGKMAGTVTKTVRKSIFKTMTVTGGGKKSLSFAPASDLETLTGGWSIGTGVSLKDYCIRPSVPSADEWKSRASAPVIVYRNKSVRSIDDLKSPLSVGVLSLSRRRRRTDKTSKSTMLMRRAAEPFAEGEIRIAYHGQLARSEEALLRDENSMVMKSFKHHGKGLNDRKQYLKQMEVSTIAHFLAKSYNESCHRPSHCARIRVLQVCVVEEEEDENEKHGSRRFCAEERLPPDAPFTKYSNNTGLWDADHLDESLLRFTEFTYLATDKYLMVTDLQGVRKGNTFILTDPVILCKDSLRFGHTNLGEKFMKKCINSTQAWIAEKGWA